ncbi:glycerate kinase [Paracidovorax sp. MALMAid1276]|uniref:glycerate kinase n=1 Tax=Paracidovorax sp. MALMAid1276 TaxID=3411631 RepID=UPI003B99BDEB
MNLRNILVPLGLVALVVFGFNAYGWPGVAAVVGGMVMWGLLHFTRLMNVMKKAANRPMGYVGSAVMLNARLQQGVSLMHVVAMTQSLGEQLSEPNADPEVYRWKDGTESSVTCEFRQGKLVKWELVRPAPAADGAPPADSPPAGP